MSEFKAWRVQRDEQGYRSELATLTPAQLGEGEVELLLSHSTLNYKDALAITGKAPVVQRFPLTLGIDLAGRVLHSASPEFKPGDQVLANGWGLGVSHDGGLAQRARVPAAWLLPLPAAFSPRQAMGIGTAGYTAALCVLALERHGLGPGESLPVLVSGASGGVGSIAIALLARRGYRVAAATGKPHEADWLRRLGASEIIDRRELSMPGKPLGKERWAGAVDSVGSHTLVNICAGLRYHGAVAACGLAQGMDLPGSVAPFILRGVALLGVDSVQCPRALREAAWRLLAESLEPDLLDSVIEQVALAQVGQLAPRLLAGELKGRVVVDVNA